MTDYIDKYDAPREIERLAVACEANWAEFIDLDGKKPYGVYVILVGFGLFLGGAVFGNPEIGSALAGFGFFVGVGGGVWLYDIRAKLNRNAKRSRQVDRSLTLKGWGCVCSGPAASLYRLDASEPQP